MALRAGNIFCMYKSLYMIFDCQVTVIVLAYTVIVHDPGSCNCAIFVCYINSSELHLQSVALRSQYSDPTLEAVTLQ